MLWQLIVLKHFSFRLLTTKITKPIWVEEKKAVWREHKVADWKQTWVSFTLFQAMKGSHKYTHKSNQIKIETI